MVMDIVLKQDTGVGLYNDCHYSWHTVCVISLLGKTSPKDVMWKACINRVVK